MFIRYKIIKKIKTLVKLWSLLEFLEITEENIIIKGPAGLFILDEEGLKLDLKENLKLNSKFLLLNCEEDFDPIEEFKQEKCKQKRELEIL